MAAKPTREARDIPQFESLEPRLLLSGTTYLVNSLADVVAVDGVVTLREAAEAANTNLAVNEAAAGSATETDVITFDEAALQAEAGPGNPLTITLGGTRLTVYDDLEIQGLGEDVLTIDANGLSRVLYVSGGATEVELIGLTITGGTVTTTFSGGGGIYNDRAVLTLRKALISGNSAYDEGGGIHNYLGTVTFTDSTVSDNWVEGDYSAGGGIYNRGTLTLTRSTVSDNSGRGDYSQGGGIYSRGALTLTNSIVSGNWAKGT